MRVRNVSGIALCLGLLVPMSARAADEKTEALTPRSLSSRLAAKLSNNEAEALAQRVQGWFGKEKLASGAAPKVDGLEVAWAIEAPGAEAAEVISEDGQFRLPLTRLGKTHVFAATVPLPDGTGMRWAYQIDGKRLPPPRTANP
jgi:enterochelin esterase family protein